MRRGEEFIDWCRGVPTHDCFASIPVIARRVREVQDELREWKRIDVLHVIMTSDETDPSWWAEVSARGWLRVDHSSTAKVHGKWCALRIFHFNIHLNSIVQVSRFY
jgi:hypothetical protein